MSNVYTKNLSDEIYFLNDKNIVQEIDVSGVINPIASHQLVKNISDDVSDYIDKTNNNFKSISNVISDLLSADKKIINDIQLSANELSIYSDRQLCSISSQIDKKIENISSSVAIAYRPMGTVDNYGVLEVKLEQYLSLSDEQPMSSHIGEVWNVTSSLTPDGNIENNNNFVLVSNTSTSSGYSWDDIGGIVDLSRYALTIDVNEHVSNEIEKLSIYVNQVSGNVTTSLTSTINTVSSNLIADDKIISNAVSDIVTYTIPGINADITTISTNVTSNTEKINKLTSDVDIITDNVDIILGQVLKTVEFVGHINFYSPEDAKNKAPNISSLIYKFNIPEKNRIKNGSMYKVEFSSALDTTISPSKLAEQFVVVKIDNNNSIKIQHGDYIIFHDHETKQFIDIPSITKENVYVIETLFADLYGLSATVLSGYAYLSGNTSDHAFKGQHDFTGTINVKNLSAEKLSATNLSVNSLSATYLSANSLSAKTLSATSLSATNLSANNLSATLLSTTSLSATNLSANNLSATLLSTTSLSATNLSSTRLSATDLSANSLSAKTLSATSLSATDLSANSLSAKVLSAEKLSVTNQLSVAEIITPSANLSTANISVANVYGNLSVNFGNVYDTSKNGQTLCAQINTLSTAIDNKIHIGDAAEISSSDLIVRKLNNKDYAEKLNNNEISSNTIYIIEDDYVDVYGQIISNAINSSAIISSILNNPIISSISSDLSGYSEVATVNFTSGLVECKTKYLSSEISSKIYIEDPTVPELANGKYNVDLSVIKLAPDEYIEKLTKDEIKDTALYVLCADYVDSFGQVISNAVNSSATYKNGLSGFIEEEQLEATSNSLAVKESEAATVEYVNAIVNARITNSYNRIYNALNEI